MAPSFESLPLKPNQPRLAAWGLHGTGREAQLGQLNLLTEETTKEAAKLVQTGQRVSLNAPIDFMKPTCFGRMGPTQKMIPLGEGRAFDDELHFNTQGSTQWDGFRHFSAFDDRFYNGYTSEQLQSSDVMGMHLWQEKGIVGRGVFLDYYSWACSCGKGYDPLESHAVQLEDLLACAKDQNVDFKPADILIIRWGFTDAYLKTSDEKRKALAEHMVCAGMAQTDENMKWLWDNQFAAVASDCPNFEMAPGHPVDGLVLHRVLLGGWGMPIGEIFILEELARLLKEQKRSSFFFVSEPLHVVGGVASPPNALALL